MKQGLWKKECKGSIQLFWNGIERRYDYYGCYDTRTNKLAQWRKDIANLPGIWSIVITPELD